MRVIRSSRVERTRSSVGRVEVVAERPAARHDRDLVDRHAAADDVREQRVPGLVVGDHALLVLGDRAVRLEARDDALQRVVEVDRP